MGGWRGGLDTAFITIIIISYVVALEVMFCLWRMRGWVAQEETRKEGE